MAEEDPKGMEIDAQKKTFDGFVGFVVKAVAIILVLVIVMGLANA